MNIQDIVSILTNSGIEQAEAVVEVKMLIEHFCHYGAKDIIMGRALDYEKLKIVKEQAELRAMTKIPVQYIIGTAYFMGNLYKVTPDVLIPRDETEILSRCAIDVINKKHFTDILDIGTGSGCISCSIAKNCPDAMITAIDISAKALEIAKINSKNLNISTVEFLQSDLFENIQTEQKFDVIVSNPPYIPKGTELQKEVTFEPKTALFAEDENGIEFYKKIINKAKNYLRKGGFILFELGISQAEIVKNRFNNAGFSNIVITKDLAGIDRVIYAEYVQ